MRALPVVFSAFVLGCTAEKETPPKQEPASVTTPPVSKTPIPMTRVTWARLQFPLPTAWKENPRHAADGRQIVFDGPRDKGEPTVSLFWVKSRRTLESWAEYSRNKYDHPRSSVQMLQSGWTTAGGKRAFFMLYELSRDKPTPGFDSGTHITIDWYFQHDGHVGFLRCTSQKEYFASGYRPLFESMASRLRFLPAPR